MDTSLEFWRSFSDSIVEWKVNGDVILAGEYQIGTQRNATAPGNPRALYMGVALPMRWHIEGPWSVAIRPEVYWDRNGLMTSSEQLIKVVTTTAEYKLPYKWTNMIGRLEYRSGSYRSHTGAAHADVWSDLDARLTIKSRCGTFDSRSNQKKISPEAPQSLHRFYFLRSIVKVDR